jgi:hypothetical protein
MLSEETKNDIVDRINNSMNLKYSYSINLAVTSEPVRDSFNTIVPSYWHVKPLTLFTTKKYDLAREAELYAETYILEHYRDRCTSIDGVNNLKLNYELRENNAIYHVYIVIPKQTRSYTVN